MPIRSLTLTGHDIGAASSIALNLAEGSAKSSRADRARFYQIALASLRECQAVFHLEPKKELEAAADQLAACLYKLWKAVKL